MKTTKEQRAVWRAEYASKEECPGCGGKLPVHHAIVSWNGAIARCSWGDTMALLDDLDETRIEMEKLVARFASYHKHGPAEPNAWGEAAYMLENLLVDEKFETQLSEEDSS